MTTPAQPTPPAPATPAPPASARDFFQQDDAALAAAWGVDKLPTEAPADPVIPEAGPPPPRAEEGEPSTPGAVDLKPLDRKPMTEFSVLDTEGEVEIPDVKIKFKAKGEVRELPLDHVVRLAQFGYANEEREQQVLAARKFVAEAEQRDAAYQRQIQEYESHYDRLFNDPAFYEEARLAYLSQNTPEARLRRTEQQLQHERETRATEQEAQQIMAFTQQQLVPTIQKLLTENPHVNEDEVIGRYTALTAPLLVNGRVPPSRFAQLQQIVNQDLSTWVQQKHVEREIEKRGTSEREAKAKREAEIAAQQTAATKRQASRVFAHAGTPSADPTGPQKPVKYNSAKDWLNATFATPTE